MLTVRTNKGVAVMWHVLSQLTNQARDLDFTDIAIVGSQHILGCTARLMESFISLGCQAENIHLIGKAYSTCREVVTELRLRGIQVDSDSTSYCSHEDYDKTYDRIIRKFAQRSLRKSEKKGIKGIIVLDDGGVLIEQLAILAESYNIRIIGAVEQTSSGHRYLDKCSHSLDFPIISVARSSVKLGLESSFIASNCINVISKQLGQSWYHGAAVLLCGKGAIASAFQKHLSTANCIMFDPRITPLTTMLSDHPDVRYVIGCTGATVLQPDDYLDLTPGLTLISASSSDREFSAHAIRAHAPKTDNPHVTYQHHGVRLLQSGFPINFTGDRFASRPEDIDLTLSLIFGAVVQIVRGKGQLATGLLILDEETQKNIVEYRASEPAYEFEQLATAAAI